MSSSGWQGAWKALRELALSLSVAVLWAGLAGLPNLALARRTAESVATVPLKVLPFDAQGTYRLIVRGGPFPYAKDGTVFGNRERVLPSEPRGYYREYTVRTPGGVDRGARRIVCGGRKPTPPETCFYTSDHYNSFQRILP